MTAPEICPRCKEPTRDGFCRHCLLEGALAGLISDDSGDPGPPKDLRGASASDDPAAGVLGEGVPDVAEIAPDGYEMLHPLGEGGTATVWLARETRLNRLVALKFISATADPRLRQRLIREGQAVAQLRHRHIVAVHAMNVDERHAWLAMDFLEGGDLRDRLAQGLPAPAECAALVQKLADALAHAHAGGLLHRDIKASNVLLDAQGEPFLADFGLVAPMEGGGDMTMPGQIAGTAAYLAPELLSGAEHASAQSDLYALGTVLYECLTGRAPFVGNSAASIFKQIAEAEPPAPHLLRPDTPRDLDTICLKCLEKAPARRYASALALRDDLGRFLRGETIAARPAGRVERVVRWCRHHPATAALGGIAAVLLLCLAIGGPLIALRLARANARASEAAASAEAVNSFLEQDMLAQAAPENEPDRDLRLITVLDRAAQRIDGRFPKQPLVEASVSETIGNSYMALGKFENARALWQRAYDLRRRELGPDDPATLRVASNLFTALRALSHLDEAEALGTDVLARQRRLLAPDNADLVDTLNNFALLRRAQGRYSEAESLYVEAITGARASNGVERAYALQVMSNLVIVYRFEGKLAEADRLNNEVLDEQRRLLGPEHPDTVQSLYFSSVLLSDMGRFEESERAARAVLQLRQKILGADHPETLACEVTVAVELKNEGKLEEAESLSAHAFEHYQKLLGPDHADTFQAVNCLAVVQHDAGRLDSAEGLLRDTLERERRVFGPDHPSTLATLIELGRVYFDELRLDDARAAAEEVRERAGTRPGSRSVRRIEAMELLGRIAMARNEAAGAEKLFGEAVELRAKRSSDGWETWVDKSCLGEALTALGRFDEAGPLLKEAQQGLLAQASKIPAGRRSEINRAAARIQKLKLVAQPSAAVDSGQPAQSRL